MLVIIKMIDLLTPQPNFLLSLSTSSTLVFVAFYIDNLATQKYSQKGNAYFIPTIFSGK